MKFLKQFLIIAAVTLAGELLHRWIPFPVPAGIYGMVLLFVLLCTGLLPLSAVRETGKFLISIMGVMFVPAAVGLLDAWDIIRSNWLSYLFVDVVTTLLVMAGCGFVTQTIIRAERKKKNG